MALQLGYPLGMPVSRPMSMIAVGVDELRLREPDGNYGVFYYRKHPQGILVLRAFRKKTEQTPQSEILLARRRLKEMKPSPIRFRLIWQNRCWKLLARISWKN